MWQFRKSLLRKRERRRPAGDAGAGEIFLRKIYNWIFEQKCEQKKLEQKLSLTNQKGGKFFVGEKKTVGNFLLANKIKAGKWKIAEQKCQIKPADQINTKGYSITVYPMVFQNFKGGKLVSVHVFHS